MSLFAKKHCELATLCKQNLCKETLNFFIFRFWLFPVIVFLGCIVVISFPFVIMLIKFIIQVNKPGLK